MEEEWVVEEEVVVEERVVEERVAMEEEWVVEQEGVVEAEATMEATETEGLCLLVCYYWTWCKQYYYCCNSCSAESDSCFWIH